MPLSPGSNTPTGDSLQSIVTTLALMTLEPGPTIILLCTDGEPNTCADSGDMAGGQATSRKTARNDRNGHNATRNVKQVQAGYAEESGAKQRRTPRILKHTDAFINKSNPFTDVESGKYHTQ